MAAFCRHQWSSRAWRSVLEILALVAVHAAYVVAAVIAYRRRPVLGLLAAAIFVLLAFGVGAVETLRPHLHDPGSRYPQGSPIHWQCHTLDLAAFAIVLAPVPPLTVWLMRRATWSRPPRFIEELTLAIVVSAAAWLPAMFALLWVFVQQLGCDTL